jgi:hypothetical protein
VLPTNYLQVAGLNIRDVVEINSKRLKLTGVRGLVTGFAHGHGLTPYVRVRFVSKKPLYTESLWFRRKELTRTGGYASW